MTDPIVTCPACDTNHEIHGLDTRITMYVHRTDKHGRAVSFHCGCNNCRNRLGRGGVNMSYEGKWCKCSEEAYQPHVWSGNCVICKLPKNGSPHTSNHYYKKEMPNTITIAALESAISEIEAIEDRARGFIRDFDALGPAGVNPITFTVLIPQNYLV